MKLLIPCITLLFLASCSGTIETFKNANLAAGNSIQGGVISGNVDERGASAPKEAEKIDEAKIKELNEQNEKFRQVPDEFREIDFKNFKYPGVRLKNGEYDDHDPRYVGGVNYGFEDVFYLDLNADEKKEAIVFLYAVGCGGSCDGGRSIIYFYSSQKGKPKLIDVINMGSKAGGCSLKSFAVKDKKIHIEQFGRCVKETGFDENKNYSCKFCAKDLTSSVYTISRSGLVKESTRVTETAEIEVNSDGAEISIND